MSISFFEVEKQNDIFKTSEPKSPLIRYGKIFFYILIFPAGILLALRAIINYVWIKTIYLIMTPKSKKFKKRYKKRREDFFKLDSHENIKLKTADHKVLDGLKILHPSQKHRPHKNQKWLLYLNGIGDFYEKAYVHNILENLSQDLQVNVLTFNYRGIYESQGFPKSSHDLLLDAEAAVQYLISLNVPLNNIVIHGHSLGAGIGTTIASYHQEEKQGIYIVADRCFSSLSDAFMHYCNIPIINWLGAKALPLLGWHIDSKEDLKKIPDERKLVLYHRNDGVVRYEASLHHAVKLRSSIPCIDITTASHEPMEAHRISVHISSRYTAYKKNIKKFLID